MYAISFRILYGKMFGRATGPGHQSEMRKNSVLSFAAGFQKEERAMFLDLLFSPIEPYLHMELPLKDALNLIQEEYDLAKAVPVKKLQG